ncbi:hypothetical protein MJO28_000905 [Puccinia striiformis f. sp. tritici]|uniref:Uncharacterized protein n=1 Tax=Puccinia striiformis f. sp. tritici TaxID=168172 RepID=A0ACC0F0B0_9BASI|nr:hypothetical protein MJO28_000905 [Puccinia striiformis f. sp. tritici]
MFINKLTGRKKTSPPQNSNTTNSIEVSSLGLRHYHSTNNLRNHEQDSAAYKLSSSPSTSSVGFPSYTLHPNDNSSSPTGNSSKIRSRKGSLAATSHRTNTLGAPALPKDYFQQQERFQDQNKFLSSSSSSSLSSSSTGSIDLSSSSVSLSGSTPTPQPTTTTATTAATIDNRSSISSWTDTPTPANQLARIPNHQSQSQEMSTATGSSSYQTSNSSSSASAGSLSLSSDAYATLQTPIRPRASSYHTSPDIDRAPPLPPPPPPPSTTHKRPSSLFSSDSSLPTPTASLPPTPHTSIDSTSLKSTTKKPARRSNTRKSETTKTRVPTTTGGSTNNFGIAGALALSGVSLAPHSNPFNLNMNSSCSSLYAHTPARSPDEKDDRSIHTTDSRAFNLSSYLDDQLGTGYAVASRKRNVDFHAIFKSIPEDDYLIEDYGCALQRDILVQGRLYISEQHLCFNANIFGWVTTLVIPFTDVITVEKRMTALIIPNAIQVITTQSRHTFASFLSRDATIDLMTSIWNIARPPGTEPTHGLTLDVTMPPLEDLSDGTKVGSQDSHTSTPALSKKVDHLPTQCDCSTEEHYKELIWDASYPTSPEKLYNILFQSDFLKDFWVNEEHLTEIEVGDWTTAPDAKYPSRSVSYIRPVNAPVGPKTIKCYVSDEHRALDFDHYVSILSTTKTPDAPAGGGFCVKTLTCITWGPNNSSRWLVTAAVEWTKVNRFLKSIIESSAISGQKAYQVGVDQALRKHIQLSQPEPVMSMSPDPQMSNKSGGELNRSTTVCQTRAIQPGSNPNRYSRIGPSNNNNPSSAKSKSKSSGPGPSTHAITINGVELSWMMIGSIGLVLVLLVWNLLFIRPISSSSDNHKLEPVEITTTTLKDGAGHDARRGDSLPHLNLNHHQLSRDVAHTVKEALHEYFRDHPLLLNHPLPSSSSSSSSASSSIGDQASGDRHGLQDRSGRNDDEDDDEEIKQIELLLQSLEFRIRNVRQSIVDLHSNKHQNLQRGKERE